VFYADFYTFTALRMKTACLLCCPW